MQNEGRLTLSVSETAKLLGLSKPSVYQGIATGDIYHIKIGRRILIPVRSLEKLLLEGNGKNSAD